jgi:diguanylate cyclase (GGDEF)-like protein
MPKRRKDESKTVLIVEDDANGIRRLCELLTHRGFVVLQASSKEEALDILATGHAELVLLNADSFAVLQQRDDQLAAVNRLSKIISVSFDVDEVYRTFATEVGRLIHYDRMVLLLQNDADRECRVLRLSVDQPATGWPEGICTLAGGTGIEWVMFQRRPHIEQDLAESKQFIEDETLLKAGVRSCLRLPLVAKGRATGGLCVDSVTPHCYGEREIELLLPLSEQLAVAIETGRLLQEAHWLAITDELTGLFNHRQFYRQLEQELKRTQRYDRPLSLIMLDVDRFKPYNDLNGHLAGDEALRLIAARLQNNTRGADIVARYGGDEFGIILPETDPRQALVQAERIRMAIESSVPGGQEASDRNRLTVSLGVACLGADMRKAEDLVRAADEALYCAKAAGGNRTSVSKSCDLPRPSADVGQGR